jgi:hypothetical protein
MFAVRQNVCRALFIGRTANIDFTYILCRAFLWGRTTITILCRAFFHGRTAIVAH